MGNVRLGVIVLWDPDRGGDLCCGVRCL